jgi:hypothetical protein
MSKIKLLIARGKAAITAMSKRAKILVVGATVAAMIAAIVVVVVVGGGGSRGSESFTAAESAWEACKNSVPIGSPANPACKPLAAKACQTEVVTASEKEAHTEICETVEGRYLGPKGQAEPSPPAEHPAEREHEESPTEKAITKATNNVHESEAKEKPREEETLRSQCGPSQYEAERIGEKTGSPGDYACKRFREESEGR